ncbi:helix-turn-helix domain-containing protein [Candidatus Venteria ishoeyi]|uniref:Helix-turn-helix n=1 Tax=Candidatus Venteria ishoeyi TaxID=1899563 RepID=A0A1H6FD00_9GAMM|nr:helix-turn-helix transcriptional regulator [Candidatus Venteria ishoeyi]SEH07513.1 Helix-turn-helix [Candidatus Venteria ishoeyi]
MQIHEKLKVMRQCKNWTQEDLAEKLGWAVNSYAKIERGEVDIKLDKLNRLAEVMGVDIHELIDANDKTVLNFAENCHYNLPQGTVLLSETQCAHELEKAQLLLRERDKQITGLEQQVLQLQEMVVLMKQSGTA